MDRETQANIHESMETLANADQYYRWLCSRVKPYIGGKALEIGAGIGNFARWAKDSASEYHASDADPEFVRLLSKDFNRAFQWDLYEPFPTPDLYDTIIILNVIEHLEDDAKAVRGMYDRLLPGGHLIVMVPAMDFLFGSMDRAFGHYRRYTKKKMCDIIQDAGFQIRKREYVNVIGMFGWFLYGRILKRNNLPEGLCSHFNLVLPLLWLERPVALFTGLSLIVVAKK